MRKPLASALILATSLGAAGTLWAQPANLPDAADIDWVAMKDLTEAQRAKMADGCCGMYIAPQAPAIDGDPAALHINGIKSNTDADSTVEVDGPVTIQQGTNWVTAQRGVYDQKHDLLTLDGDIHIRRDGTLLIGRHALVNRATATDELDQASYLLHGPSIRGKATALVYREAADVITIENGEFTRCEPGDNAWLMHAEHIVLDQKTGIGTARDMTLRIKDVPILYFPWITFPITDERTSGFLTPVLGFTRKGGYEVAAPYYLNLAPNYDMTLTPRYFSERGGMLGVETRYLGRNFSQILNVEYLPGDERYDPLTANTPGTLSPPKSDRWEANYRFGSDLGKGWSAGVDYRAVSDMDFFPDFSRSGLNATMQSYLYRNARVDWRDTHWNFSAITENIQVIDPTVTAIHEPYRTVPRLKLDGMYWLPSGLQYGVSSELTVFDRDIDRSKIGAVDIANGVLVTGSRLSLTPELSLPMSTSFAFFTPTLKYKYAAWTLNDQAAGTDAAPTRGVWSANIDTGLVFERDVKFGGQNLRQTLEPRLYYLYNQYKDQNDIPLFDTSQLTFSFNQLFRDDRFSGKDRIGDTNQVTMALSSHLYDDGGREKAAFSLGQIHYFADRRVTLQGAPTAAELSAHSALTGEAGYQVAERWHASSYVEWNTTTERADVGSVQLQYQSDANHLVNLAWRYRDMPAPRIVNGFDRRINQSDVSAIWPIAGNWNLVGRWDYDYSNKRTLEGILGVEYGNCCWRVRVVARSWIDSRSLLYGIKDNNTGVFVQFELKGLGSLLGGNVTGILNNGISGFRDRNNVGNSY